MVFPQSTLLTTNLPPQPTLLSHPSLHLPTSQYSLANPRIIPIYVEYSSQLSLWSPTDTPTLYPTTLLYQYCFLTNKWTVIISQ